MEVNMNRIFSSSCDDMDRLDGFVVDRAPQAIASDLIKRSGGDPILALTWLVERAVKIDDELDTARLALDEYRKRAGEAPLVLDAERRAEHIGWRKTVAAVQENLNYMYAMGLEDPYEDEEEPAESQESSIEPVGEIGHRITDYLEMPDTRAASSEEEKVLQNVVAKCGDVGTAMLRLYRAARFSDQNAEDLVDEVERIQKLHYDDHQQFQSEPADKPGSDLLRPVQLRLVR
jgi:hypothetical protein